MPKKSTTSNRKWKRRGGNTVFDEEDWRRYGNNNSNDNGNDDGNDDSIDDDNDDGIVVCWVGWLLHGCDVGVSIFLFNICLDDIRCVQV